MAGGWWWLVGEGGDAVNCNFVRDVRLDFLHATQRFNEHDPKRMLRHRETISWVSLASQSIPSTPRSLNQLRYTTPLASFHFNRPELALRVLINTR
jgi:hypothetical protein